MDHTTGDADGDGTVWQLYRMVPPGMCQYFFSAIDPAARAAELASAKAFDAEASAITLVEKSEEALEKEASVYALKVRGRHSSINCYILLVGEEERGGGRSVGGRGGLRIRVCALKVQSSYCDIATLRSRASERASESLVVSFRETRFSSCASSSPTRTGRLAPNLVSPHCLRPTLSRARRALARSLARAAPRRWSCSSAAARSARSPSSSGSRRSACGSSSPTRRRAGPPPRST